MKSFLPPNCVKGGMCLLHLREATMHTVKRLLQGGCGQQSSLHRHALHKCQEPKVAPCKPKAEPSVCYMCDEPIPRKRDTNALELVSCDARRAMYHLRCAKLARVPRHGSDSPHCTYFATWLLVFSPFYPFDDTLQRFGVQHLHFFDILSVS